MISEYLSDVGPRLSLRVGVSSPPATRSNGETETQRVRLSTRTFARKRYFQTRQNSKIEVLQLSRDAVRSRPTSTKNGAGPRPKQIDQGVVGCTNRSTRNATTVHRRARSALRWSHTPAKPFAVTCFLFHRFLFFILFYLLFILQLFSFFFLF